MRRPKLTLIEGQRAEHERLFLRLRAAPESLSEAEFEHAMELFEDRICRAERVDLIVQRLALGPRAHCLEERCLLEIMVGDLSEARRLRARLERRDALGLRVIEGGVASAAHPGDA